MPFSFNPGQQAQPQAAAAPGAAVPSPAAPTAHTTAPQAAAASTSVPGISTQAPPPPESKSPFSYKNRSRSMFAAYFQFAIFGIFGMVVLATAALFIKQRMLLSNLEDKKILLSNAQDSYKKLPLEDMQDLSARLAAVNLALKEHTSVRAVLRVLERSIQDDVTYTKLDFSYNETKKLYSISFQGETKGYHSAIQQIKALKGPRYKNFLSSINVSKVRLDDLTGIVSFDIDAVINVQNLMPEEIAFVGDATSTKTISKDEVSASSTVKTSP